METQSLDLKNPHETSILRFPFILQFHILK